MLISQFTAQPQAPAFLEAGFSTGRRLRLGGKRMHYQNTSEF
jgi:hypothetical protein